MNKAIYYVPVGAMRKGAMVLRLDPPKNNQKVKVRYATDFLELRERRPPTYRVKKHAWAGARVVNWSSL